MGSLVENTTSKMQEKAFTLVNWTFENWKNCHRLLAAKSECIVKIGNVILRFFLLPVEKTVKVASGRTLINEWYSLNVQLISSHQEAYFTVRIGSPDGMKGKGHQVFLRKSPDNPRGTEIVLEEFLLFGKWMINWYTGRKIDSDRDSDHPLDVTKEEFTISLKVTLFQFEHKLPNGLSPKAGLTDQCENARVKSKISTIFEETEGKLFSDIKLQMDDGEILHAHRIILAGASPVFKAMFTTDMEESSSGIVKIPDICSTEMKIVLVYIYTGSLSPVCAEYISEVVHVASKYQLDDLLDYCDKMVTYITNPSNAMMLLKLAKTYNLAVSIAQITEFVRINATEILMSQVDI